MNTRILTDEMIDDLRREAVARGDMDLADACVYALGEGDYREAARERCAAEVTLIRAPFVRVVTVATALREQARRTLEENPELLADFEFIAARGIVPTPCDDLDPEIVEELEALGLVRFSPNEVALTPTGERIALGAG